MTLKEQAEIARRARQDAQALRSGWPSRGSPYQQQDAADLWQEHFEAALKEGKK
jgi:hypothetical protein